VQKYENKSEPTRPSRRIPKFGYWAEEWKSVPLQSNSFEERIIQNEDKK
jgi:hypothetical protein